MDTEEILTRKKIRPEDAAAYLQNGTTALDVRIWAQNGTCPFAQAFRRPGSRQYTYRIHLGNLQRYKAGEPTLPLPKIDYYS